MSKRLTAVVFFLLLPAILLNVVTAEKARAEIDDAFIAATFENYSLQSAVQMLIKKDILIPLIIEEAQKAGYSDGSITAALYQSELPPEKVVVECMLSHMSARHVLKSLEKCGTDPETVLGILVKNKLDKNRVLATCGYMLDQGYTKAELVKVLARVGADRNIIIKVSRQFDIPPATTLEAYKEVQGEPGEFGHVFTRHSLPQPARIAIGVARIHNSDAFENRPVISPKTP
jgi:hypothetical protein